MQKKLEPLFVLSFTIEDNCALCENYILPPCTVGGGMGRSPLGEQRRKIWDKEEELEK